MSLVSKKFKNKSSAVSLRNQFLKDLAQMYDLALEAKNFAVALRALELRAKELGLFKDQKQEQPLRSLQEMSKEELEYLLKT